MFKLPHSLPIIRDSPQEWADYAEYLAIRRGRVSMYDLYSSPSLLSDEEEIPGIEDDDDKFNSLSDDIIREFEFRIQATNERYPFTIESRGQVLKYIPDDEQNTLIYTYLLLCTRNKMNTNSRINNIDGALVFEKLCGIVAQNYFGYPAEYEVMGTGRDSNKGFRLQLENIISKMKEGGKIKENLGFRPQDDKVDIMVWKHFSDGMSSKLIGFGQCKTGTSWKESITQLQPTTFCKKWFTDQLVVDPVRMFFTAQFFPIKLFQIRAYEAGLVFDRFRIMDYLPESLPAELKSDIQQWTESLLEILYND